MGWMAPGRHLSAKMVSSMITNEGAIHEQDYAHVVLFWAKAAKTDPWLTSLRARKHRLVAAVALANKKACIAWAVMSKEEIYRTAAAAP